MERRVEGLKRLGGPVGTCSHCGNVLILVLPEAGQSIYRHHWHIEKWIVNPEANPPSFYRAGSQVVCSEKCAEDLADECHRHNPRCEVYVCAPCVESS